MGGWFNRLFGWLLAIIILLVMIDVTTDLLVQVLPWMAGFAAVVVTIVVAWRVWSY